MRSADAHADLFLAGEAEPQGAAAAIGQGETTGVAVIEVHPQLAIPGVTGVTDKSDGECFRTETESSAFIVHS